MVDIHHRQKQLERGLMNLEENETIIPENKKLIFKFDKNQELLNKNPGTRYKDIYLLTDVSELLGKPFKQVTKQDILELRLKLKTHKSKRTGNPLSEATQRDYLKVCKKFFKFVNGGEEYPKCVSWLKLGRMKGKRTSEDILSMDEIHAMLDACDNPRDSAFLACIGDTGARIGEVLNMKIKHVVWDEDGVILNFPESKTEARNVYCEWCKPWLASWLENHPDKRNREAWLWVSRGTREHNKLLGYKSASKIPQRVAERVGIQKPVNCHNWRASCATYLAKNMTTWQLMQRFGWTDPKTAMHYIKLSGEDVKEGYLKAMGKTPKIKDEPSRIMPKRCARCKQVNKPNAVVCDNCAYDLTKTEGDVISDMERRIKALEKMPKRIPKTGKVEVPF